MNEEIQKAVRREIIPQAVIIIAHEFELVKETREELLHIQKLFKRGFYNYKDVEKVVTEMLLYNTEYTYFGPKMVCEVATAITSDVLFCDGYLS